MNTLAVTFGDALYEPIAKVFAKRFQELNGIDTVAIDPKDCPPLEHVSWIKAWIWDLVPASVERVIWFDVDNIPIAPVVDLLPSYDYPFSATLDSPATKQEATWTSEEVRACEYYLNLGFFVARRVTQPIFDELKTYVDRKLGFIDQSAFNVCLNRYYAQADIHILSQLCNWIKSFGNAPTDVRMLHLAGWALDDRFEMLRTFTRVFEPQVKGIDPREEALCAASSAS